MQLYYVIPAPQRVLFEDLTFDQFWQDPACKTFALRNCFALKYQEGITLETVREKIISQWTDEITNKPFTWEVDRGLELSEHARILKEECLHAYIVFSENAKAYAQMRKACRSTTLLGDADYDKVLYTSAKGSSLQKIRAYSAYMTFLSAAVDFSRILTDGSKTWLQHSNPLVKESAGRVDKDCMMYSRLTDAFRVKNNPA